MLLRYLKKIFYNSVAELRFNRMDREEYLELVKMNTGIEITSVESSNIEGIGYNVKKHHLWVSFKNNKVYRYDKVLKSNSKDY